MGTKTLRKPKYIKNTVVAAGREVGFYRFMGGICHATAATGLFPLTILCYLQAMQPLLGV